jgi:hypothetical protein
MRNKHLRLAERIELEAALRAGDTQALVAARLGRAAGTISRELALNGGRDGYRSANAHQASVARRGTARRGHCAIEEHPPLRDEVQAHLRRGWSPEEIAGILKLDHPDLPSMHTSHESIYRYVYIVARGERQRRPAFLDDDCIRANLSASTALADATEAFLSTTIISRRHGSSCRGRGHSAHSLVDGGPTGDLASLIVTAVIDPQMRLSDPSMSDDLFDFCPQVSIALRFAPQRGNTALELGGLPGLASVSIRRPPLKSRPLKIQFPISPETKTSFASNQKKQWLVLKS